jgi:hypothetical protein
MNMHVLVMIREMARQSKCVSFHPLSSCCTNWYDIKLEKKVSIKFQRQPC